MSTKIADIAARLRRSAFPNEQAISTGVVLPVLQELDWNPFDPGAVWPEYKTKNGGRVDFALCHPRGKPQVFIEVKALGKAEQGVEQILNYAFFDGVKLVVLTDGRIWRFYLPFVPVTDYGRRLVSELDLTEKSPDEAASELHRYLEHERVATGASLRDAQADHGRQRVGVALPEAWSELARTPDRRLVTILSDAVEKKVGVRPKRDEVLDFLQKVAKTGEPPIPPPVPRAAAAEPPLPTPRPDPATEGRVVILGTEYVCANAKEAYIRVFRILAERDLSFCERFAGDPASRGKKNRYIARTTKDLYPNPATESFRTSDAEPLAGGWWLGTHLSNKSKRRILCGAARVAGLELDKDIIVPF